MTDDGRRRGRCSFLGSRVPPGFAVRRVVVAAERPYDEAEWLDAIVVVERGEVELECDGGRRCRFRCGDVLFLVGLPLRAIHPRGGTPAVLVAVSRGGTDESPAGGPSYDQSP